MSTMKDAAKEVHETTNDVKNEIHEGVEEIKDTFKAMRPGIRPVRDRVAKRLAKIRQK